MPEADPGLSPLQQNDLDRMIRHRFGSAARRRLPVTGQIPDLDWTTLARDRRVLHFPAESQTPALARPRSWACPTEPSRIRSSSPCA